eukprot:m.1624312 g.1624312  ORF g.1624312 m.1624312 type:complete len:625 (-) comp25388_c0_seq4:7106-8980(-)
MFNCVKLTPYACATIFAVQCLTIHAQQMSVSQAGNPRIDFIPGDEQSRASQSNLLGTVQLPLDYEIGLNITPDATTVAAWSNIIHITANDNNCCNPGDRVPGIWFYAGTTRLHIIDGHSPVSSNDECTTPLQLPALQTTRVRLFLTTTQTRVFFNDTLVCSEARADRAIYPNAKVYASNPWFPASNAWISGFYLQPLRVVRGYQQHTFLGPQPQQLSRGYNLGTIDLPINYEIGFSVVPTALVLGYSNIIHMTANRNDCCNPGDRIPGVWFYPNTTRLHSIFGSRALENDECPILTPLPMGAATQMVIRMNNSNMTVFLNGTAACTESRTQQSVFNGATFFASDPWYPSAQATIANLYITDLNAAAAPLTITGLSTMVAAALSDAQSDVATIDGALSTTASEIRADARDLAFVVGNLTASVTGINTTVNAQGSRLGDVARAGDTLGAYLQDNVTTLTGLHTTLQGRVADVQLNVSETRATLTATQTDVGYLRGNTSASLSRLNTNVTSLGQQQATTAGLVARVQNNVTSLSSTLSATSAGLGSLRSALQSALAGLSYDITRPDAGATGIPQVTGDGQDVVVAAGSGGTVRVSGSTCASMDLCAALEQISTITTALNTAVAPSPP